MGDFDCPDCGREYASRSGYWKHSQKCVAGIEEEAQTINEDEEATHTEFNEPPHLEPDLPPPLEDDWFNFAFDDSGVAPTESLPPILKKMKPKSGKSKKKMSAKEQKERDGTNSSLLVMGLGGVDYAITRYGRAVTENPDYECSHSETDKRLVANAQLAYLKESGIDLSNHLSTGKVAFALTGYYVVPPVVKIRRESKRGLLPKIGWKLKFPKLRFWRRKPKPQQEPDEVV